MKWIYKRKANPENGTRQEIELLKNFRGILEKQKLKWAKWMGQKTSGLSKPILIAMLCLFILSTSLYSGYLVVDGFTSEIGKVEVSNIKRPKHFNKTGEPVQTKNQRTLITQEEYQKIKKFTEKMDSLSKSPSGRVQYESLVKSRPGLLDSLKKLESLYQQLNK